MVSYWFSLCYMDLEGRIKKINCYGPSEKFYALGYAIRVSGPKRSALLNIHDISRLRVNNLTLILLTWRKW